MIVLAILVAITMIILHWWSIQWILRPYRILDAIGYQRLKVLDVGTGDGYIAMILSRYHDVTSVDVVDKGFFHKPLVYDGKMLPFPDNNFDAVVCSYVLHHDANHRNLLREMRRVSKRLVIVVEDTPSNNIQWWFTRIHGGGSKWNHCVDCFNTTSDWTKIFVSLGFGVERTDVTKWYLEFPFSSPSVIYPVDKTMWILIKN